MGSVNTRPENNRLFLDFRYQGERIKIYTKLTDTPANRKKTETLLKRIEAETLLGTFDFVSYFPDHPKAKKFAALKERQSSTNLDTPLFADFAQTWLAEKRVEWRDSHFNTVSSTFDVHLNPYFGKKEVGVIKKADILDFRAQLAKVPGRNNGVLSPSRINHIMTPLRMITNDSADRFDFTPPYQGIKSLRVPRTDVEPFSLDEVWQIINTVRADFRAYYTVRFFTGMRTAEIDGLRWRYVDFERRQILIREAWVKGKYEQTKNDGSAREISMSQPVYEALQQQQLATGHQELVFCNTQGTHLRHNNVTKRVWYPLLAHLGLRKRRPYQTRHTAATLWLASDENPEWIARQMGHTTTEMLFRVYARYVPNLTRQDGSAFENLLLANKNNNSGSSS